MSKASHVGKEAFPVVHEARFVMNKSPNMRKRTLPVGIEACPAGREGEEGKMNRIPRVDFADPRSTR